MSWAIPRFDHVVEFSGASHAGRVRTSNEDVWKVDPGLGLLAVADGMGGHAAGEIAAKLAIDELCSALRTPPALQAMDAFIAGPTIEARRAVFDQLEAAAVHAHGRVKESAEQDQKKRGMGSTLDAALLLGNKGFLVHIGDGRAYLARQTTTIQLTHDHTLHGSLAARGVVTPSQPPNASNVLTNAVGRKGNVHVEEVFFDLAEGDRLLMCTDGVHGELGDEGVISELARKDGTVAEAAVTVVNAALDRGGRDNATALLLQIGSRRVDRRAGWDQGLAARDASFAAHCPLLLGVADALVARALRAAVEVELEPGKEVPRFFTGDRVAYIVLEGRVDSPSGWALGPSSIVYPESLAGGGKTVPDCKVVDRARAFRIRADDFREVCAADVNVAAALYQRLAHLLARASR